MQRSSKFIRHLFFDATTPTLAANETATVIDATTSNEVRYVQGCLTTLALDGHQVPANMFNPAESNPILHRVKKQLVDVKAFHDTWMGGVDQTALVSLQPLATQLGLKEVWMKDESTRLGLKAFKGLGVSWAVEQFRRRHGLKACKTLATMTDGNHGRALAYVAQQMHIPCVVFVPGSMVPARREAIEQYGADVVVVKGSYDDAILAVRKEAEEKGWTLIVDTAWEGYTEVPLDITVGYTTIFREAEEQLLRASATAVTHVFLQAGVGGFASAGVAAVHLSHSKAWHPEVKFVVVEPTDADCILENVRHPAPPNTELRSCTGATESIMAGLNCGQPSILSWPILRDLCAGFVAVGDTWAKSSVKALAKLGVVSGESGAAGLAGLQALMLSPALQTERCRLGLGADSVVMLVSTEGDTDPVLYQKILAGDV